MMDIKELKSHLDILEIARALGISTDKNGKALCPFHNDKNPSLQFSKEKQICTCFSSNCHAGTMDVVELTKKYNKWELPETLNWLAEQVGIEIKPQQPKEPIISEQQRIKTLTDLFETFTRSFASSGKPQQYLQSRNLDPRKVKAGYNIGQFHHTVNLPEGKADQYRQLCESLGLLKKVGSGYNVFGKGCVVFPLRNKKGQIVSFYYRETNTKKSLSASGGKNQHYYLKNRQGLYPGYPKRETKKLILTESIIDAETLLQTPEITQEYEILACYGTEGIKEQTEAVSQLEDLQEVIIFFDGDKPGKEGAEKLAKAVLAIKPKIKVKIVETPEDQDVNSLIKGHEQEILNHLIKEANPFFLSSEKGLSLEKSQPKTIEIKSTEKKKAPEPAPSNLYKLDTNHPHNLKYSTETATYEIKGGIGKNGLDRLIISLHIIHPESWRKLRVRLDLYEDKQTEKTAREAAEKLNLRPDLIEHDLQTLTDLLDEYREQQMQEKEPENPAEQPLTTAEWQQYTSFGREKDLMERINRKIGQAGIVGEEKSRLFLFAGAVSHLMPKPLNIVVQGSSGSGKSYLIRQVSQLVPQAKVKRYTRLSEKSFYNFGEYDLCHRLVIIEDYDGMNEEVEYAFRELQSNGELVSAVSGKEHEHSDIQTRDKIVRGPIASMVATTKGDIYHDNSTRVFFLAVDESPGQTQKIIEYKNKKANLEIQEADELAARHYLQGFVKTLKPYPVKNPYLKHVQLPVPPDQLRRVHELLESFCTQITLIHQHQRQQTKAGELIADKQDMQIAIELMFDSIILKIDELDGSLRDFYEKLKTYVLSHSKEYLFMQREIRQALQLSKTHCFRNISQLEVLEYIRKAGFGSHGATTYRIIYWDDNQAFRQKIKADLQKQMERF